MSEESTGLKTRLKNLLHKKSLLTSLLLVSVIALIFSFSFINHIIENENNPASKKQDVLGYKTPQIYISGGENGYSSGGMIALASTDESSVTIRGYNVSGKFEASLYEADEKALLEYLTHDSNGKQINKNPDINSFRFIKKLDYNMTSSSGEGANLLLPLEESGIYFLRLKQGDLSVDSFIVRSKNGALVKEGDNEFIFWGQNYQNRRSMTEGSLSVYNLRDGINQIADASLNSDGIAKTRLAADADIALIRNAGDKIIVPINLHYLNTGYSYAYFRPKEISTKYFTFTDRPLYKPGDTVFFKSILRNDDDARYSIPSGQATAKLYEGWGEDSLILEKNYTITGTGAINGEFKLPDDAKTGYYRLLVSVPGGSESYISFDVEYYRKPEYTIDVTTSKTELIAGDNSTFTISGNYFSGQPLSDQTVTYKIYSGDYYDYEYIRDQARVLSDDYRYGYWGGSVVNSGEVTLNRNGIAEVDLETILPENKYKNQVFSIEASYNDQSGNPVFSRKNVLVYSGEYGIYRGKNGTYRVKTGEKLSLPVTLVSHRNTSVNGIELTADVHRENWIKYQEENKKYPSYRKEEENLKPIKVTTDNDGNATFSLIPSKPGYYNFTIEGEDERGNIIQRDLYVYVTSDTQTYYFYGDSSNDLTIQTDKNEYEPNDTVRFTITSNTPNRDVFLSMERGRVNRYQVVKMTGDKATVDVPLVTTDMPNIFAKVSSFSDVAHDEGSTNVSVSAESKRLTIDAVPNSDTFGPGDTVTVNISTTNEGGSPVSAEVAVWAVDKAIFELRDDETRDIFDTFWRERYDDTNESHSLEGIMVYTAETGGGCFAKGTKVLMANGKLKPIEDIEKGEYVLTKESENSSKLVKAKVVSTYKAKDPVYMIINKDLRITADHILWVNNSWKSAGSIQIGDKLINSEGSEVKVDSIEWLSGDFEVYNLGVEKYHSYFANNIWVHNQKGGPRTVFKDTAYWNPSVRTNESGRAQISFKLPDNLTTWVIAAVAATSDTKVGQNANEIVVTKDVIVRPILPNIFRVGDEIVLSALVHNFTEEQQTFNVDLEFNDAELKTATESGVSVESKGIKEIFWDALPNTENEDAKLIYSAWSDTNDKANDTITQTIPVRAFGFREPRAETGNGDKSYDVNLANDIDKEKTFVTLSIAPTILGTLPTAMNYLVRYPYGCVEQTTSSFVPALIAKANSTLFASAT